MNVVFVDSAPAWEFLIESLENTFIIQLKRRSVALQNVNPNPEKRSVNKNNTQ